MRDNSQWSLNCGMWGGVRVYVHASLLLVFVAVVYFATQVTQQRFLEDGPIYGFMGSGILLAFLLLHEFGHALAAWRLGGGTDLIVLGPFGGMQLPNVPREPHREVIVALAGPLVHFLALVALGPALIVLGVNLGDLLLHPLYPQGMLSSSPSPGMVALKMAFWFNWVLLLVNLAPGPALDGGRALRSILWPVMGYSGAIRTVSRAGMMIALTLCLLALVLHEPNSERIVPTWLPLVLLALYFFFSSQQEVHTVEDDDQEDDLFGYDFSQGFSSLDQPTTGGRNRQRGPMRRWLQQRQEMKERRLRDIEADEEQRVDEVLIRVKELGIDGLSPEDRSLLHRVSERYRSRLQS
jgi:stage IV sporulation protein FB